MAVMDRVIPLLLRDHSEEMAKRVLGYAKRYETRRRPWMKTAGSNRSSLLVEAEEGPRLPAPTCFKPAPKGTSAIFRKR